MDAIIFEWAEKLAEEYERACGMPMRNLVLNDMDIYTGQPNVYDELYVGETDDDALFCERYTDKGRVTWCKLINLAQVRREAPEVVELLMRQAIATYTRCTNGRGLKVVNIASIDHNS